MRGLKSILSGAPRYSWEDPWGENREEVTDRKAESQIRATRRQTRRQMDCSNCGPRLPKARSKKSRQLPSQSLPYLTEIGY